MLLTPVERPSRPPGTRCARVDDQRGRTKADKILLRPRDAAVILALGLRRGNLQTLGSGADEIL